MTRDAAASVCPRGGAVPGDVAVVRVGTDPLPQVPLLLELLVSLRHCVLPVGMYVAVLSYQSLARLVASHTPSHHVTGTCPALCPEVCAAHMRLSCVKPLHVGRKGV